MKKITRKVLISLLFCFNFVFASSPKIDLTNTPLNIGTAYGDKPVLLLNIGTEYPILGTPYIGKWLAKQIYSSNDEYIGYFNHNLCYEYKAVDVNSLNFSDSYFKISGKAVSHKCNSSNSFSGNFLNFVSSTGIDIVRMALTGGDRWLDTEKETILQRAVLSWVNGYQCMWNRGDHFPTRILEPAEQTGAIPSSMKIEANNKEIFISNKGTGIYFLTRELWRKGAGTSSSCNWSFTRPVESQYLLGKNLRAKVPNNFINMPGNQIPDKLKNGFYLESDTKDIPVYRFWANTDGNKNNRESGTVNEAFFQARVKVCVDEDIERDYEFCQKQPSGYFKPIGAVQKYADNLRVGAFSFLLANHFEESFFGGVLRQPIKYVGQKTFDMNGTEVSSNNPKAEWDAITGIFHRNPDNHSLGQSGLINYLNKFGRLHNDPMLHGYYLWADHNRSMYYESLRYLRGFSKPTKETLYSTREVLENNESQWIPSMRLKKGQKYKPEVHGENFPVYETWEDPFGKDVTGKDYPIDRDYSCQKIGIAHVGDIHDWAYGVSITNRFTVNNENYDLDNKNFEEYYKIAEKFEKKQNGSYFHSGQNRNINNPNLKSSHSFNFNTPGYSVAAYMIGMAYWAHVNDIRDGNWLNFYNKSTKRPGMRITTYTFDINEGCWSCDSSTLYGGGINVRKYKNHFFLAAKYGGFRTNPGKLKQPYNTYGNPFYDNSGNVNNDVWQDPNRPEEAANYYMLGENTRDVLTAFDEIFQKQAIEGFSVSASSVQSSKTITSTESSFIYKSTMETESWTGDVLAYKMRLINDKVEVDINHTWSASDLLKNRTNSRKIFTNDQELSINSSPGGIFTNNLIRYLHGQDVPDTRKREYMLGSIVNSNMIFSGSPKFKNIEGHSIFAKTNKDRKETIFVGANDGMLHAFDANNGEELFAFIPKYIQGNLHDLMASTFNTNNKSYVDGQIVVDDAKINGNWKTVLVSGLGRGGSAVFGLDVTNPETFNQNNYLFEFTRQDDKDLGFVLGQPKIIQIKIGNDLKWFAVFGSGVNNNFPDPLAGNNQVSIDGTPYIFFLSLDKPRNQAWRENSNYHKIKVPLSNITTHYTGKVFKDNFPAGILGVSAQLDKFGVLTNLYIGDFHGDLWKLNFKDKDLSKTQNWSLNYLTKFRDNQNIAVPIYRNLMKNTQDRILGPAPITADPLVIEKEGLTYVSSATGKYLEAKDGSFNADNNYNYISFLVDNSDKFCAEYCEDVNYPNNYRIMGITMNHNNDKIDYSGWLDGSASSCVLGQIACVLRIKFADKSERVIYSPIYLDKAVGGIWITFNSIIPNAKRDNAQIGICDRSISGNGKTYVLNLTDIKGNIHDSDFGLLGPPMTVQIKKSNNGIYTSIIQSGEKTDDENRPAKPKGDDKENSNSIKGRISWRQINNFNELSGP